MYRPFKKILDYIKYVDFEFEQNISNFLNYYNIPKVDPPFFTSHLAILIKISIYSLALIIPVTFLKIIYNKNKVMLILFLLVLITLAVTLAGTFLGFFQLAF